MKKNFILMLLSMVLVGSFLSGCTGKTTANAEENFTSAAAQTETETPETETETTEAEEPETEETYKEGSLEFYQQLAEDLNIVEIYDSNDLTLEMLQNRNGKIIIEKCIGKVTSPEGDGIVLNYDDTEHYYICYSGVENISEGAIILTYFVYNPDTNYEDDILERFDYVIDSGLEN